MATAKKTASAKKAIPAKKATPAKAAAPAKKVAAAKKAASAVKVAPPKAKAKKGERDIEKAYPLPKFIEKLRRLSDALEQGKTFRIQVAGERITIPANAVINIEHEREEGEEEVEFQLKWKA